MKLPIPLLLYSVSLGLAGFAGWTVYKSLPLMASEGLGAASSKGANGAKDKLGSGKGHGAVSASWQYTTRTANWWAQFREVNFIGKLPPPPPDKAKIEEDKAKKPDVVIQPLEQIIELVSLVYDPKDQGKGELSHVIVRYRPDANVQPPEWYERETQNAAAAPGVAARPRDTVPPPPRSGGNTNFQGRGNGAGARPTSQLPTSTSTVGREILQKIWIQGGDDPRRQATLWPPYSDIKLVRVDPSAQIAYFVRTPPPAKEGEAAPEAKEEELLKSSMDLPQDLVRELHRLNGAPASGSDGQHEAARAPSSNTWQEVEETTLIDNVRHIGRKDEERMRANPDELFDQIHVDTYVSRQGSTRGIIVKNVDNKVSAKFGVMQGDVLIEINNRPVQTQAQAVQFGKAEYRKGVRTFVTKWMSGGQIVERTYQAPDR